MFKENGTGTCLVSDGADLPKDFQTIVDEVKKNRSLGGNQITVAPGTCNWTSNKKAIGPWKGLKLINI